MLKNITVSLSSVEPSKTLKVFPSPNLFLSVSGWDIRLHGINSATLIDVVISFLLVLLKVVEAGQFEGVKSD